ncbi:MAG: hypothetical protein MJZ87_01975 [Bacteroidales bacterium]|nr:hypothetical protein [Bacteroidales bacterium]
MKKLAVLAIVCCAMVLTSCHRPVEFYSVGIDEYHFASGSNETSVKAVLGTIYNLWEGQDAYKGMTADVSDIKAITRYDESVAAIMLHANELKPYFQEGDYFVYTLKRTTEGEVILIQNKFYLGEDGNVAREKTYDYRHLDE